MSGKITPGTRQKLDLLDARFKPLAGLLLEAGYAVGLNPQVSCGFRSGAEQDLLYSIGRTKPVKKVTNAKAGESAHNYGVAVDIFFLKADNTASFEEKLYKKLWAAAVEVGLDKKGLSWSGNWVTFKETAHFELTGWKEIKHA